MPNYQLNSVLDDFENILYKFLTSKESNDKCLIKRHTDKLNAGEFSFVNSLKPWQEDCDTNGHEGKTFLQFINKTTSDIIKASEKWHLSISSIKEDTDRVYLFLNRPKAIQLGILEAISLHELIVNRLNKNCTSVLKDPCCSYSTEPTYLRLEYLIGAISNIHKVCLDDGPEITVTSKSSTKENFKGYLVHCNTVLNSKTGAKEVAISSEEFIRLRQNEMMLIAQHKYGLRVQTESKWKAFIDHLGESAVAFEMLQIKYSNPIRVNFENQAAGSSKGASFVLYNCARLETLLKTFEEKVVDGTYPPLPSIEDVDFNTLSHEDEWTLMFTYVMGLPSLLHTCVELREKACEFRPHLICGFLSSMVRVFSQYYRRVRILTEPRKHMLPVLYARIYMLRVLNESLKICLKILNIKSVSQM